jgi:hypothetical protein
VAPVNPVAAAARPYPREALAPATLLQRAVLFVEMIDSLRWNAAARLLADLE